MNMKQMQAAKEAMAEWLAHPQELGHKPAAIECAGTFELHDMLLNISQKLIAYGCLAYAAAMKMTALNIAGMYSVKWNRMKKKLPLKKPQQW